MRRASAFATVLFGAAAMAATVPAWGAPGDGEAQLTEGELSAAAHAATPGAPAGGAARPRMRSRPPFHYVTTFAAGHTGLCADGIREVVRRVWDDGSGRVDVVFAGCPRPRRDRVTRRRPPTRDEIRDAVGIPEPVLRSDPPSSTLTGLSTGFWYEGPGDRSVDVGVRGVGVHAAARAVRFVWDMGDGTRYVSASGGTARQPAVRHAFRRRGTTTVTLTITWTGSFTVHGPEQEGAPLALGAIERTASRQFPVEEVQPVGTPS